MAYAEMAIKFLDGIKVGGASLAVKWAKFPFSGGSGSGSLKASPATRLRGFFLQGRLMKGSRSLISTLSWRDGLAANPMAPREIFFLPDEEKMVAANCFCDLRTGPDGDPFP